MPRLSACICSWQRCTRSSIKVSSPAGFSTFWTNRIGSGLRFYSFPDRIRIFKFHFFGIWRQHNHKKNFCKGLNDVMQFTSTANVWERRCYTDHRVAKLALLEPKTRNLTLLRSTWLQIFYLAIWLLFGSFATSSLHIFFLKTSSKWRV